MQIQQFDLLQKSAVINIQTDLEAAVAADTLLASQWASNPENSVVANGKYSSLHYMEKSKDWAENPENVAIESGLYSSKHHAIKSAASSVLSSDWAEKAEDSQVATGKYSSKHWAAKAEDEKLAAEVHKNKADKFANESEDVLVEPGKYSAKHWATKSATSYDNFDDRWLGSKTGDPTLDNDGNALQIGAVYWNTNFNELRTWSGSAWVLPAYQSNLDGGDPWTLYGGTTNVDFGGVI